MRRWRPDDASDVSAIARLLADYLVATEREKGVEMAAAALPERYRREVEDPVAAHRGAGIAGTMVEEALAIARRRGDRGVRLTVWQWREAAIRLYERSGFASAARWDPRPGLVCLETEFCAVG
ncbi:MAG: GNAT family N-acetyltransferase [Actinomycetes bacterium]